MAGLEIEPVQFHHGDAESLGAYAVRLVAIGEELNASADVVQTVVHELGKLAAIDNNALVKCTEQFFESGLLPIAFTVPKLIKEAGSDLATFANGLKSIQ